MDGSLNSLAAVQVPMLVDPVENPFDALFAPWPLRFYVLYQGRLAFKAQPKVRIELSSPQGRQISGIRSQKRLFIARLEFFVLSHFPSTTSPPKGRSN